MGFLPNIKERRRSPRYTLTEIVEVYVSGFHGRFLGCGVLHDISETGAGIHMDVSVAPLTEVELTNEKGTIKAICRTARPAYTGYIMGFEFKEGTELRSGNDWSPFPATW